MSLLSDYRLRIKSLLASDDIQQTLELEGVNSVSAHAVGISSAIVAQGSIVRRNRVEDNDKPRDDDEGEKQID